MSTPDPFDPDRLRRPVATAAAHPRLPRPGPKELYLGGPIPMGWLGRAANLPGKALHLAVAVWFEALCTGAKDPAVRVPRRTLRRLGLSSRATRDRALGALAAAGLVAVERRTGRS